MSIKRCTLILRDTKGNDSPISDEALEIMFDNCNENYTQDLGVKMMISMCLYGPDHKETQRLARSLQGVTND